jgi:deoxyribonuclease V
MNYTLDHEWPTLRAEALEIVEAASSRIEIHTNTVEPKLIAAVETDYGTGGETLYSAAVLMTFPEHQLVERALYYAKVTFPYYPGLMFFREGPMILNALAKLRTDPDLIIVSGHGIAHPALCGTACHIGLAFDKPTIGCSRRLLAGQYGTLDETKGSSQPLMLHGREVGVVYRTKDGVKPLFISPAHKCDLAFARDIIVRCLRDYRLPEPLRLAHLEANKYRRRTEERQAPERRPYPGNQREPGDD